MTTEDIIIHIFCEVDNSLPYLFKERHAKLHGSEVISIGILFALKGGHFRAFYRWLKRDYGGLPDRTNLQRQMRKYEWASNALMAQPSVLNGVDSFPIELIFPVREGRSQQQLGGKNKDKGRWSVGIKLCWILNTVGQVVGWDWATMNEADNTFLEMLEGFEQQAIMLTDYGLRCQDGLPDNVKVCKKGTWNDRMTVETSFSMLTVIAKAKKIHHRFVEDIQARLAYTAAMFNVCLRLFHQIHPDENPFKMSIAEFSL